MPYRQLAQDILTQWREAERALEILPTDSREAELLRAQIKSLRDQYQRVVEDARQADAIEPPPWPSREAVGE